MNTGSRRHRRLLRATCVLAACCLLPAVGCAKLHAKNTPESPPLEVPTPPPRVVEPPDTEVPPPVPLPEEPARHPTTGPRRSTPPQPRSETPKSEPPKADQTPPPGEPPKPTEEPKPPVTVQTIPTGAEQEVERTIRAQLSRAGADLSRVNYQALNADARTQYDSAKGYVRQAEDALRQKNLVFARSLADKAATLAAQLAGK
jgi:hypothetical protein